ncbi:NAD(P)/FAD-dependent oxidoreductase [Bermanella sp. WJH001]|uniref:NAD(P)/FAD-dependent oxidoreductase n=1 Tax=Bermanella sp. WJH001 TaxID=3048005 RepID=UPI0024BDA34F|nr:NAD(P)-binding protein [Bermanella sp. WJH001]MDJ1539216.1 NAD(P)-binding protein [Bermanella sp. WJH001]
MISTDVLVIGAGLAGLTLAQQLKCQGRDVVCVDKARGSGGRLSSKRIDINDYAVSFDLGALSFSAQSPSFQQAVNDWCEQGHLIKWLEHDDHAQYIGSPRSSSLTRSLADEVGVHFSVRISAIVKIENGWQIFCEGNEKEVLYAYANEIVLACPAPQAYELIPSEHKLKTQLEGVSIFPQWVATFALAKPISINDFCLNPNENIAKISYENSKPARNNDHNLHVYCVQASVLWSQARLDYSKDKVIYELADELSKLCTEPLLIKGDYAHRWLYSNGTNYSDSQAGFIATDDLSLCGDYLMTNDLIDGVEAAYLSGQALAKHKSQLRSLLTVGD